VETAPRNPVPVFPLPELVLFPRTVVPLHVFELRYRTMVRNALSRDRLIVLALSKPQPFVDIDTAPDFHPLGCLAKFEDVEWLPDDRFQLTARGQERVRIDRVVSEFPYLSARVQSQPEHPFPEDDPLVQVEKRALLELLGRVRALAAQSAGAGTPSVLPDLASDTDYATVVNTLCMWCGAKGVERLDLLAEDSVIERGRRVRLLMEERLRMKRSRPAATEGGEEN
jgi:Lon protease-like protein